VLAGWSCDARRRTSSTSATQGPYLNLLITRFEDISSWAEPVRAIWPWLNITCKSDVHRKTSADYTSFLAMHVLDAENRAAMAKCDTWQLYE